MDHLARVTRRIDLALDSPPGAAPFPVRRRVTWRADLARWFTGDRCVELWIEGFEPDAVRLHLRGGVSLHLLGVGGEAPGGGEPLSAEGSFRSAWSWRDLPAAR